jgi:hypothetical protein
MGEAKGLSLLANVRKRVQARSARGAVCAFGCKARHAAHTREANNTPRLRAQMYQVKIGYRLTPYFKFN